MSFSELINQVKAGETHLSLGAEWGQGRAVFGGIVAGLVYQAMLQALEDERPVRSLQIAFIGPVSVDQPLELKTEVLRQGKSVSQLLGRGIQGGQTQVTVIGNFGHARDSSIVVHEETHVFPEQPDAAQVLPYIEGVTPAFTGFFEFRYCTQLPFSGSSDKHLKGFVRFKDSRQSIDNAALLGLVDAWPPAPLPMLNKVVPASSLNWTIDFIEEKPDLSPGEFCQYQADIVHAQDGYAFTRAKIWNSAGKLLAISQQTVTVFG